LYTDLPGAIATKELLNIDPGAHDRDTDIADNVENAEIVKLEEKGVEKKRRPSRDVHPRRSRGPRSWSSAFPNCCTPCRAKANRQLRA
jgi:hypothetical protein